MSQSSIIFFIFLHIVYDNRFVSARKSPWAVPFGSDASPKSELCYQCLIRRVILLIIMVNFIMAAVKSMVFSDMYY